MAVPGEHFQRVGLSRPSDPELVTVRRLGDRQADVVAYRCAPWRNIARRIAELCASGPDRGTSRDHRGPCLAATRAFQAAAAHLNASCTTSALAGAIRCSHAFSTRHRAVQPCSSRASSVSASPDRHPLVTRWRGALGAAEGLPVAEAGRRPHRRRGHEAGALSPGCGAAPLSRGPAGRCTLGRPAPPRPTVSPSTSTTAAGAGLSSACGRRALTTRPRDGGVVDWKFSSDASTG